MKKNVLIAKKIILFIFISVLSYMFYRYLIQFSFLFINFFIDIRSSCETYLVFNERVMFGFLIALNIFTKSNFLRSIFYVFLLIFLSLISSVILIKVIESDYICIREYIIYNEILTIALVYTLIRILYQKAS